MYCLENVFDSFFSTKSLQLASEIKGFISNNNRRHLVCVILHKIDLKNAERFCGFLVDVLTEQSAEVLHLEAKAYSDQFVLARQLLMKMDSDQKLNKNPFVLDKLIEVLRDDPNLALTIVFLAAETKELEAVLKLLKLLSFLETRFTFVIVVRQSIFVNRLLFSESFLEKKERTQIKKVLLCSEEEIIVRFFFRVCAQGPLIEPTFYKEALRNLADGNLSLYIAKDAYRLLLRQNRETSNTKNIMLPCLEPFSFFQFLYFSLYKLPSSKVFLNEEAVTTLFDANLQMEFLEVFIAFYTNYFNFVSKTENILFLNEKLYGFLESFPQIIKPRFVSAVCEAIKKNYDVVCKPLFILENKPKKQKLSSKELFQKGRNKKYPLKTPIEESPFIQIVEFVMQKLVEKTKTSVTFLSYKNDFFYLNPSIYNVMETQLKFDNRLENIRNTYKQSRDVKPRDVEFSEESLFILKKTGFL